MLKGLRTVYNCWFVFLCFILFCPNCAFPAITMSVQNACASHFCWGQIRWKKDWGHKFMVLVMWQWRSHQETNNSRDKDWPAVLLRRHNKTDATVSQGAHLNTLQPYWHEITGKQVQLIRFIKMLFCLVWQKVSQRANMHKSCTLTLI